MFSLQLHQTVFLLQQWDEVNRAEMNVMHVDVGGEEGRRTVEKRHSQFFNCHLYLSAFVAPLSSFLAVQF